MIKVKINEIDSESYKIKPLGFYELTCLPKKDEKIVLAIKGNECALKVFDVYHYQTGDIVIEVINLGSFQEYQHRLGR